MLDAQGTLEEIIDEVKAMNGKVPSDHPLRKFFNQVLGWLAGLPMYICDGTLD